MIAYSLETSYMNSRTKVFAVIVVSLLAVIGAIVTGVFQRLTVISIQQITVDTGGSPAAPNQWTGTFWAITAAVTMSDQLVGYTFPSGTTATTTYSGKGYVIHTGTAITLTITPQAPYLLRKIRQVPVMVTPLTYTCSALLPLAVPGVADAQPTTLVYYDWAEPSWEVHTPFQVSITKNGTQLGSAILDEGGTSTIQVISTSYGPVRIENLGTLGNQYTAPNVPSQVCIMRKQNVYDWTQLFSLVPYDSGAIYDQVVQPTSPPVVLDQIRTGTSIAYSTYWFGNTLRWDATQYSWNPPTPYVPPYYLVPGNIGGTVGGWQQPAKTVVQPLSPVIFPEDKTSLPSSARGYMSLTEYVESRGATNLANTIFSQFSGWSVDTVNNVVKVNVPWGDYGTPIVTIRVPVEMVDTWFDVPPMSNVVPSCVWYSTGTKDNPALFGSDKIVVSLIQNAVVTSSTKIVCAVNVPSAGVYPSDQTLTLAPGQPGTVYFDITNTGVSQDTSFTATVTCYEMYTMTMTGQDSVTGTFKAVSTQTTVLRITAIDTSLSGNQGVAGINVEVQFPPTTGQTETAFTDANGVIQWTLTVPPSNVPYSGDLYLQSMETYTYKAYYRTIHVSPGMNDITLQLQRIGPSPPGGFPWVWMAVGVGSIVAVVALMVIIKRRKK
jgi:hypothetical protein